MSACCEDLGRSCCEIKKDVRPFWDARLSEIRFSRSKLWCRRTGIISAQGESNANCPQSGAAYDRHNGRPTQSTTSHRRGARDFRGTNIYFAVVSWIDLADYSLGIINFAARALHCVQHQAALNQIYLDPSRREFDGELRVRRNVHYAMTRNIYGRGNLIRSFNGDAAQNRRASASATRR